MKYLLGVDLGGGSTKATLMDEKGKIVASSIREYASLFPRPLHVEQDPALIYDAFVDNIHELFQISEIIPEDILAICIDGGTHIAVLMDDQDRVIRPAIYWSDGRSSSQASELKSFEESIAKLSFNIPSTVWTLPQLMWIREFEPENFARIYKIRFLKDYIRFRLTGDFITDYIDAMGSMLVDANTDMWSKYLCSLVGLDIQQLPTIVEPQKIVGTVNDRAYRECGFSTQTQVVVGSTDTVMELLAAGAITVGDTTIKLATAGRICVVSDRPVISPLLVTYKHLIPNLWYPGSATKSCAASFRWLRDTFSCDPQDPKIYQKMDSYAEKISPGCDGLIFHPFLQGEITPYLDASLRASFFGISSSHSYPHFCRAVMEGVAFSLREGLDSLRSLGLEPREPLRIIGGGSRSQLWSQIVADVLGVSLVKVYSDDSSVGSAMHAGVVTGVFGSYADACNSATVMGPEIKPNREHTDQYDEVFNVYRKIVRALQPIYQELT